ncbi:pyridoxamine 5'-phosphate oxidase-domain-containing protein [Scleroderma citrinum]
MSMTEHKTWFTALSDALDEGQLSGVFQLATYDKPASIPRVRTHILRAFLTPSIHPTIPLLLSTTDIRSSKITQIASADSTHVEAVFWRMATMEQFRIAGPVYIVPSPSYSGDGYPTVPQPGQNPIFDALREVDGVDWERTRFDTFNALSPGMRASWCTPVPGSPMKAYDEGLAWPQTVPRLGEAKTEDDERNQATAFGNFALLIIEPLQVDYLELGTERQRRTIYTREPGHLGFEQRMVVP